MNLVKILSLVAVAAIAAMAFVGTSSVFANGAVLLCKSKELKLCESPWPSPVTIVAHATTPKLLTSIGTIECEKSLAEITLLQTSLQILQLAHILSLGFEGNCHIGSTKCTMTVSEVGGISITHGPNPLEWDGVATSLSLGETSMNTVISMKCGFFLNCTYTLGEETLTTITNDVEGRVTLLFNKAAVNRTSGFCPQKTEWDATYVGLGTGLWLES